MGLVGHRRSLDLKHEGDMINSCLKQPVFLFKLLCKEWTGEVAGKPSQAVCSGL